MTEISEPKFTALPCPLCGHARPRFFYASPEGRSYWRCLHCEATYLEPTQLPTAEEEIDEYRKHHNNLGDPGYRRFLNRLAEPLNQCLPPAQQGLDYGCGPGPLLAQMLEEKGHRMALYDPFFYPDNRVLQVQYDFITCTEVVEHFHHPATDFARLDNLLKPGGCLAVMTCFQTDDAAFANWHYRRDPTHVFFYRENTFMCLAKKFNWSAQFPARNLALFWKKL